MKNTRNVFGEKIIYAGSIADALNKSQCAILMTHWKQFERFNNNSMKHMSKKSILSLIIKLLKFWTNSYHYKIIIGQNRFKKCQYS